MPSSAFPRPVPSLLWGVCKAMQLRDTHLGGGLLVAHELEHLEALAVL